ncbi:MAG TPA: heme-binding domain-containing protein [Chitinophagales bacterium]|nr:heme-binding domain-containing protein [Chitinophagales bacterium]
MLKKIGIGLLVVLIGIQFIPTKKNQNSIVSANSIERKYNTPENVQAILKKACYDCHSNNTVYPWYAYIQPVGFWLNRHVNEGKEELNFSEFNSYENKKASKKMEKIISSQDKGWMPLSSYTLIHKDAILSATEKTIIIDWAKSVQQQLIK